MASKRNLKRDIDYLITDVILDCYACMEEHPEKDFSAYEEIINEIIVLKEDLLERINQFDKDTHGRSRAYFQTIKQDLVKTITEAHSKLIELGC
jgi:hypothetical protein